ncbi:MAG: hypothetical protein NTY53_23605 [Kiritimatiellaeota bacterium]|nr:hypothetical protein [Kiritimatiellota bacterium]
MACLDSPNPKQMFDLDDTLAPAGTFQATCIDAREVYGVRRRKFQSEAYETADIIAFCFEIRDEAGHVWKVATNTMRISAYEKSALYKFVKDWLGRRPPSGFDTQSLVNRPATITVEHKPMFSDEHRTYSRVALIGPAAIVPAQGGTNQQ